MAKFMFEGERNPGDGSRNPLGRKVRRAIFNARVALTQNKFRESSSVEEIRKL